MSACYPWLSTPEGRINVFSIRRACKTELHTVCHTYTRLLSYGIAASTRKFLYISSDCVDAETLWIYYDLYICIYVWPELALQVDAHDSHETMHTAADMLSYFLTGVQEAPIYSKGYTIYYTLVILMLSPALPAPSSPPAIFLLVVPTPAPARHAGFQSATGGESW